MNYNLMYTMLGIIFGYFIMYASSNIVTYHGANSNDIRREYFKYNGKIYHFVPRVIISVHEQKK